jgi:DNA-directed RNA polymerase specialized sigma24 family protein
MRDEMLTESMGEDVDEPVALLKRHCEAVYQIAANLCTSLREAAEVTRQTILSASRESNSRPHGSFRVSLYGIAVRKSLRQREADARGSVSPEIFLPHFDARGRHGPLPGRSPWLDQIEPASVSGLLRQVVSSMEPAVAAAYVLCDLVDLPAREAAAILEVSPEIVRRRAHRARLMLGGFLEQLAAA